MIRTASARGKMIEATCTACGNINRVAETEIPVGAKFINCAACKARVGLPVHAAAMPRLPALKPPPLPGAKPAATVGITDLPAPKRSSALGADASRPAPRSGLAAALDAELPVPRGPRGAATGVASASSSGAIDLDDLLPSAVDLGARGGLSDLPAPKRASESGKQPVLDLPAPKVPRALADLPPPGIEDLPAPKSRQISDLPAPRAAKPAVPARGPSAAPDDGGILDLPMPKQAGRAPIADLPMPKGPAVLPDLKTPRSTRISDLPMPSSPAGIVDLPAPKQRGGGISDLPAPKHASPGVVDLLQPKPPGAIIDLPTPRPGGPGDLPAPKGFFDDLPQPASAASQQRPPELPAPLGFFDDLPGRTNPNKPAAADLPAPLGFFDDLPGRTNPNKPAIADVPAPLGFFDDLPGRTNPNKPAIADVPAPLGFFDDLPGRTNPNKPGPAEVAVPKGFFDDLPAPPAKPAPTGAPAPKGFFDDLAPPSRAPDAAVSEELELDESALDAPLDLGPGLGPGLDPGHGPGLGLAQGGGPGQGFGSGQRGPGQGFGPGQGLGAGRGTGPRPAIAAHAPIEPDLGPELDLGPSANQFDDLDLSKPSTGQVQINPPRPPPPGTAPPVMSRVAAGLKSHEVSLELAEPRAQDAPSFAAKRKPEPVAKRDGRTAEDRAKRVRIFAFAGLVVAALGAGGFYMYRRYAAKQATQEQISNELATAQASMTASDAKHWDRAHGAARKVLELDNKNPTALGIAAEAQLAAALADGTLAANKIANARRYIATAVEASLAGPQIARAQALSAISARQPERAIEKLKPLADAAPKDATLALYLGWALAAHGDHAGAVKAFDAAIANGADAIKLHAQYARGLVKLAQAELDAARADFTAVLAVDKVHIGAQVGLAALLPYAQAQQQENDLLAILARKDLDAGDPRAVVQAWVLAGEVARRGNRLDAARGRFRKALALAPEDVAALTGLAQVEVRDTKLTEAGELLKKALELSKDDLRAQIVQSELSIARKDLSDASLRLDALAARTPPPPILDQVQIKLLTGKLLEARDDQAGAVEAYLAAAQLAGDLDLTPTLAAVNLMSRLAGAADPAKASQLRARIEQLLGSLAENARKDPQLALTLGMAYLQADDAPSSETWLRLAVEGRPTEVEGHYQLAKALAKRGTTDEAIAELQKAIELDPKRSEIGLELARTYEAAGRAAEAGALYGKLLVAANDPSIELRARAGRLFARTNQIEKAAEQGAKILAIEPGHPAGLYLKAEGLLASDRIEEARKLFTQAADADPDPQYLDGQGRAAEADAVKNTNTAAQDAALRAYMAATAADAAAHDKHPTMVNPLAGLGRLYVLRHEAAKAAQPLLDAYQLKADAEVAYNLGLTYIELQQDPTAILWLQRSLELRPHAEASWSLGQLYANHNQVRQAAAALETATRLAMIEEKKTAKLVPWLTEALYKLGRVQKDVPNDAAARAAWEKYVARRPPPSAQLNEVLQALGTSLKQ
jgi:tetratricopeptide (TPR) repeat protein